MEIDVDKLTRVEVIDGRKGRVFTWWRNFPSEYGPREAELSLQDDGRTLKVFIKDGKKAIYEKRLDEDNGDVMTIEEFKGMVACGGITDYDGHGHPMKDGLEDHGWYLYPSNVDPEDGDGIPEDATHIAWYNK